MGAAEKALKTAPPPANHPPTFREEMPTPGEERSFFVLVCALFSLAYLPSLSKAPLPLCFLFIGYRDELKQKADRQLLTVWIGHVPLAMGKNLQT